MPHAESSRRPWTLWALSLIIAAIGAANVALALDHALHAERYRALGVSYPPLLRAALALGWGGVLLALAIGLAWRDRRARRWALLVLSNYGAFGVLWMSVYAESSFDRGRIGFQAALTLVLLALLAWVLRWKRIRAPFEGQSKAAPGERDPQVGSPTESVRPLGDLYDD